MPRGSHARSLLCGTLLVLISASTVRALDPSRRLTQYVQSVWQMEDGLPHNTIRALVQAKNGYIWLGTYGGLVRFDGVRFRVFDNRNSGLRDNEVRSLAEDKDGTLWVGTTAGGLHRLIGDQLQPFDEGIGHRTINALQAAPDGVLWVGTSGGLYSVSAGKIRYFGSNDERVLTVMDLVAERGRLWVGSTRGLFVLEKDRLSQVALPGIGQTPVASLLRDRAGRLWIGLANHLLETEVASGEVSLTLRRDWKLPDVWGSVHRLLEDRDSNLWIGTYGGGLYRISQGHLDRFSNDSGFLDHRPWSLLEDREGSVWVGTRSGLARLTDGPATTFSVQEGLPADIVRAVYEDSDGSILIATLDGFSRLRGTELKTFTSKDGLPPGIIRGFLRDRRGRMWVNTGAGVVQMDTIRDRFGAPIGTRQGAPTPLTRQLLEDRAGRMWLTTERGVAVAEKGLLESPLRMPKELEDIRTQNIESIFEDREGWIWIGTITDGLRRWKDGLVETEPLMEGASIGVRAFHQDQDGTMFIGTVGAGLFVRRAGATAFKRISTRDGLTDDAIWAILQDGDTFWMSSDRGVLRVKRSSLLAFVDGKAASVVVDRLVDARDGMKSRECNGGGGSAGFIARDGRIWFPTTRGAVAIEPGKVDAARPSPLVAIEEVVVDQQTQPASAGIDVPPGSRDVEIHYTGLSFVDPTRLKFRYRLEGYDADWVGAGDRRVAYFSRLPPGDYRFRVEASYRDDQWTASAVIPVSVKPRIVQTNAFRAFAALGLLGLTVALFHLRTRQLRARAEELKSLVATRTAELEKANEQLGKLATVDDLTGIANHRRFIAFLDQEWLRCQRGHEPLSLLLCDIDDFKAFNDTRGHQAGDACLARVAQALDETVQRTTDLAARYGGEEFAVVLPSTDEAGARAVAEAIQSAVHSLAIPHDASRASDHVTFSIGCATIRPLPGELNGGSALIAAADQALYAAKGQGRDRIVSA